MKAREDTGGEDAATSRRIALDTTDPYQAESVCQPPLTINGSEERLLEPGDHLLTNGPTGIVQTPSRNTSISFLRSESMLQAAVSSDIRNAPCRKENQSDMQISVFREPTILKVEGTENDIVDQSILTMIETA